MWQRNCRLGDPGEEALVEEHSQKVQSHKFEGRAFMCHFDEGKESDWYHGELDKGRVASGEQREWKIFLVWTTWMLKRGRQKEDQQVDLADESGDLEGKASVSKTLLWQFVPV
jgi:hypothetical protein